MAAEEAGNLLFIRTPHQTRTATAPLNSTDFSRINNFTQGAPRPAVNDTYATD
jgi:hypothetical protein